MSIRLMKPITIGDSDLKFAAIKNNVYYGSPKLDGIRGAFKNGVCISNSGKPLASELIQKYATQVGHGFDGEWIYGSPSDPLCYNKTQSAVNSIKFPKSLDPNKLKFWVFDIFGTGKVFEDRLIMILPETLKQAGIPWLKALDHTRLTTSDFIRYYTTMLDFGYEGAIFRRADTSYHYGRAGKTGQEMLRMKPFGQTFFEAKILECYEQQTNLNIATESPLGYIERSSASSGKVGNGKLGGFVVQDTINHVVFKCSASAMTDVDKEFYYKHKDRLIGSYIRYKCMEYGTLDAPRQPVFAGFRSVADLNLLY